MSKKQSLFWEIGHPDHSHKSYLLGTIHISNDKAFDLVKPSMAFFDKTSHYFGEMDLDVSAAYLDQRNFMLPQGQTLENLLGARKYQRISNTLYKYFDFNLDAFNTFIPFFVVSQLQGQMISQGTELPMDHQLWEAARSKDLTLGGVERLNDQMEVMAKIPIKYQLKMLKDFCRNIKSQRKKIDKLLDLYLKQEIHKIYKITNKQLGEIRPLMLYNRNEYMASYIYENREYKSFYTVGAAHLAGQKGVLAHLKQKGHKLQPIRL